MSVGLAVALVLSASAAGAPGEATPAKASAPTAPAGQPPLPGPTATRPSTVGPPALDRLAADVAARLAAAKLEAPLGVWLDAARPLDRAFGSALVSRLSELGLAPVLIAARSPEDAESLARGHGVRSLARLGLTVEGVRVVVRGDGLSTWVNFWSGRVPTRAGPAVAIAQAVDADEALQLLAGVAPPTAPAARPSINLAPAFRVRLKAAPSAVAAGDLDGDGKPEVALLLGDELSVYGTDGALRGVAPLAAAPAASQPTRDAFGALAITASPARAWVWSGRRAKPVGFAWDQGLKPIGVAEVVPLDGVGVRLEPGVNRFLGDVSWAGKPVALGTSFQATSTRSGVTLFVGPDGWASLVRGTPPSQRMQGVGAGSTLADVDGDGTPELVATTSRTSGDADEVRVLTLSTAEQLQARGATLAEGATAWQGPAHGRVVVAAAADLDGDGAEELLLGAVLPDDSGELVVLKGAKP